MKTKVQAAIASLKAAGLDREAIEDALVYTGIVKTPAAAKAAVTKTK